MQNSGPDVRWELGGSTNRRSVAGEGISVFFGRRNPARDIRPLRKFVRAVANGNRKRAANEFLCFGRNVAQYGDFYGYYWAAAGVCMPQSSSSAVGAGFVWFFTRQSGFYGGASGIADVYIAVNSR